MTTEEWIREVRDRPEFFPSSALVVAMALEIMQEYRGEDCGVPAGKIRGYLREHPAFQREVETFELTLKHRHAQEPSQKMTGWEPRPVEAIGTDLDGKPLIKRSD